MAKRFDYRPRRRGAFVHAWFATLTFLAAILLVPAPAWAAFNNATPRDTFAGTHNYVVTGNTLRTQSNAGNPCLYGASSNATVSGIPAGSTIDKAYLYWGGSGVNPDPSVNFGPLGNVVAIAPDDNFDNPIGDGREYFGGVKDVTSQVTGNGTYQFGGLTVDTSNAYCSVEAVVAGWALVVVYRNPAERYRYTRIYDGLQFFRGSSVTTTQSGFRVPDLLDGKVSVVTWEGDEDAATSTSMDGFDETLTFDGYPLFNTGCDLANNIYNSTISSPGGVCSTTSYGVDIDTYDVTNFLYEGQTGATLEYSSGNDRVFLTAQVISTTNTPVADLGIDKSHQASFFTAGQNASYDIVVHNYGPEIATGTATVTDTLPTGLSYVSAAGSGWTCGAVGQVVTCNNSAPSIANGASLPTLSITVAVAGDAAASVDNTATVSHPMFDGTGGNQTDVDTVPVRRSNLSTSTKTVVDLNGGDAEPGDTLRYTITLSETGGQGIAATGVAVVDDLAANLGNLSIVSIPAGAIDNSVGSGGANGTGQVNVAGITVAAGGSAQVVFDVTISGDANPGDSVNNAATITNGSGPGATPAAPAVTVASSQAPTSGNKVLYVHDNQLAAPNPRQQLTRTAQTTNTSGTNYIVVNGGFGTQTWPMTATVATGKTLLLPAQTINVRLFMRAGGNSTGTNRPTTVTLLNGNTPIATSGSFNINGTTITARNFPVTIPATSISAGNGLNLRVNNNFNGQTNRQLYVYGRTSAANLSTVSFSSDTVVNVDDVSPYLAVYPSTSTKATFEAGDSIYIRANVSDPFGGYDVTSASLVLKDGLGNTVASGAMTARTNPSNNGTPNRIFEYGPYVVPANANFGTFVAEVTAKEGSENTVSHTRNGSFTVAPKALTVTKASVGDFTAGANGSYTLTVANTGGSTVTGTTTVKDTLATGLTFVSGSGTGWGCSAAGQVVTCTSSTSIPASSSMAPITLTVAVAGNLGSSVDNMASVGNSTIASGFQKDGNLLTTQVRHPDLSTSTKSVLDLNGGDANPGDTLRYTITVKETAGVAANNAGISDTMQTGLGTPAINNTLTTCNGTPSVAGATLSVSGLSLPAGGTCTLVFDTAISQFAAVGFSIDNAATLTNPNGPGAIVAAPTVTVSASQQATSGNKVLYVYATGNTLSRTPHGGATATRNIAEAGFQDFSLGAVAGNLSFTAGQTITIALWLQRPGGESNNRDVYVQLFKNGTAQIGANSNTVTINNGTLALQTFTITAPTLGNAGNLAAGDTLTLRVVNNSSGSGTRSLNLLQYNNPTGSTITFATSTVVHVDSVAIYSAAYPSTAQATSYGQGEVAYVRAVATDPFGFADISGGTIVVKNPGGTIVANATLVNGTHTVGTPSGATRTYEYAFTVPPGAAVGGWTASVTAKEGTENTVSHTGNGGFSVGGKITLRKVWGMGATAGHAVTLTISGGTSAVAGSSTAPSTLTPATANGSTGATITLAEAYTSGSAGQYTVALACVRDSDGTTVTVSGNGLSRTITMPPASVTCSWNNSKTVPLTVVKLSSVVSDPVNGGTNPKAIPGAIVEYQIILTNPAATATDANTVVVTDPMPQFVDLRVADIAGSGSGPVVFIDGSPSSGLSYTFTSLASSTDDVSFSNTNGATWTYVPVPDVDGLDPAVTNIRINPKGAFNAGNGQFTVKFRVRVK